MCIKEKHNISSQSFLRILSWFYKSFRKVCELGITGVRLRPSTSAASREGNSLLFELKPFRMSIRGANGRWKPPWVQLAIRTVSSTHVMILPGVHALAWTSSGEWPPSSHEHAENTECNKVRVLVRNTLKPNGHVTKLGKGGGAQTGIRQIFLSRYNASWKKEDSYMYCIYAKICMWIALDT